MTTWENVKQMYITRSGNLQYTETSDIYHIKLFDGITFVDECVLYKDLNLEECIEFETDYKSSGNSQLSQMDTDGAQIVRIKAAKRGWTYSGVPFEIKTSTIGSLHSKHFDGTDKSGVTLKFYDASDYEITAVEDESDIVNNALDFEPGYDYEVIGGTLGMDSELLHSRLRLGHGWPKSEFK